LLPVDIAHKYTMDDSNELKSGEECGLENHIHKTSNFILLLPFYNNAAALKA
jgi:hypothetical protein